MSNRKVLSIGSLSEGTLRDEDIWDALVGALEEVDPRRAKEMQAAWDGDLNSPSELLHETLYPCLEEYLPPFCYLGSADGDGASIGVWVSSDGLQEAIREGDVFPSRPCDACRGTGGWIRDSRRSVTCRNCRGDGVEPTPVKAHYRLAVSDHGNMTLYYRNGRVVWSLV